jgi:DNA-binding IclR family transcriptional regulator
MKAATIPDDVRRFILTSIPSVPYLEAVLLLQRAPSASWEASSLARRLYLPEAQARDLLQALEESGVAMRRASDTASWQYQPPPQLAEMLQRVARDYRQDLIVVTDLIHSRLNKKAFKFADAFVWRKDA